MWVHYMTTVMSCSAVHISTTLLGFQDCVQVVLVIAKAVLAEYPVGYSALWAEKEALPFFGKALLV